MELTTKVRVAGQGNLIWEIVEKSSPIRQGEWILRRASGEMLSAKPSSLKVIN
jgi:hypothetical protein